MENRFKDALDGYERGKSNGDLSTWLRCYEETIKEALHLAHTAMTKDAPTVQEVDLGSFEMVLHRAVYCVEKEKDMNECEEHDLFLHQLEDDLVRLCDVLKQADGKIYTVKTEGKQDE